MTKFRVETQMRIFAWYNNFVSAQLKIRSEENVCADNF
ncbi:hypothetical protein LRU_01058 [Ligilactobacillus ruminis SPM0211]|uniref:Uncharacterized protein n=1 Tax=Ligilactobacillus ruminis SPM0211 TaxID=1040964 RepID=F7R0G8_9LACO|nr:hypothetical protein LRU_01058 [Ligilactobacillus ruminis SPM0211]